MILTSLLGVALTLATPSFNTTEPMVHDPVMAYENGTYYLSSTGENIQEMTSADMRTWTLKSKGPLSGKIPAWTRDSVPGFRNHVWAPDIIRFNGRWYENNDNCSDGSIHCVSIPKKRKHPMFQTKNCHTNSI